ncbi:MAG: excisionase family DNA-binding protein [Clostridia bacterium]|nr:excisionase family DNA-binding protein [Clostridia bacterium]
MNEDILYTPEEIAQKLKLTKGTVYEMIKRGELEAHRIGRYLRISRSQFDKYLLKSRGLDNTFEAVITKNDNETYAVVGTVQIHVNTEHEGHVKIAVPPENIILSKGSFISSARNVHKGKVIEIVNVDSGVMVVVDIGIPIKALITKKSFAEMGIEKGTELYVIFKTMSVTVYK